MNNANGGRILQAIKDIYKKRGFSNEKPLF